MVHRGGCARPELFHIGHHTRRQLILSALPLAEGGASQSTRLSRKLFLSLSFRPSVIYICCRSYSSPLLVPGDSLVLVSYRATILIPLLFYLPFITSYNIHTRFQFDLQNIKHYLGHECVTIIVSQQNYTFNFHRTRGWV